MALPVVKYGDPVLRRKGAEITEVTPEIHALIDAMIDTMRVARGIGLAAHQVGRPLQLTTLDVRDVPDRPSQLWIDDQPADPDTRMPMVLINPRIRPLGHLVAGPEGCLSFPGLYSDIHRPSGVEVEALDATGTPFRFRAGGLLARAIQHEVDHLNGILFIDRMGSAARDELAPGIESLFQRTRASLTRPEK